MELKKSSYDQYKLQAQVQQQHEETCEIIVPDTQPDVYEVLTSTATLQLRQKSVRRDAVTLEGSIDVQAVCLTEEAADYHLVRSNIPFTHEYALAGCQEQDVAEVHLSVAKVETVIRNPRKLQFQVQLEVAVQVYQQEAFTVVENAIGTEEESIQAMAETTELEILRIMTEKKVIASEDLAIVGNGMLLRTDAVWVQEEQKILTNKVMLRGNVVMTASIMDNGEVRQQEYQIPYSQIVECESIESSDMLEIAYQTTQIDLRAPEGGGGQTACTVTGYAWAKVTRKQRVRMLKDFYSTRYMTAYQETPVGCCRRMQTTQKIPAEETIPLEEPAVRILHEQYGAYGGVTEDCLLCGCYTVQILYCCANGRKHCVSKTIRVTGDTPVPLEHITCTACMEHDSVQMDDNGNLCVRFSAVLKAVGCCRVTCTQIGAGTLNQEQKRTVSPAGTLILRNVGEKESVWSIAKQYGTRTQEIIQANKLTEGAELTQGQLLLIPFAK